MPETSSSAQVSPEERGFRATMMFHPSHHVTDLTETERWFQAVFGRESMSMVALTRNSPPFETSPGFLYPRDYSTFTLIGDVLFDSIDPERYVVDGIQRYSTIQAPHLRAFGWYVEGIEALYRRLRAHGILVTDQFEKLGDGEEPPGSPIGNSKMFALFSVRECTGLRYEFCSPGIFPADPRKQEDWTLPPVPDDDPLGIEYCSHHTVLTRMPERALKLVVDVLGGEVIDQDRNELRGADSTYVSVADGIIEYAVPDRDTAADGDWKQRAVFDTYHALTWKVVDLDRVQRHLESQGVRIESRSADTLITDPATSIGVPWGFTTRVVPGDPRVGAQPVLGSDVATPLRRQ